MTKRKIVHKTSRFESTDQTPQELEVFQRNFGTPTIAEGGWVFRDRRLLGKFCYPDGRPYLIYDNIPHFNIEGDGYEFRSQMSKADRIFADRHAKNVDMWAQFTRDHIRMPTIDDDGVKYADKWQTPRP